MASITVTLNGQLTLKPELLQHLGIKPGERITLDKLPGGELLMRADQPVGDPGDIETFIGRHAAKVKSPLAVDEINEIAASGWAKAPPPH